MKRGFCFVLLLVIPEIALAFQQENLVHITADDGLSQNLVFDMEQDHEGFIWIGTKDGLSRYDGYEFKIYRNNPSDPASLASNYVTFIKEDKAQNLWVETSPGGLHFYDRINEKFIRLNAQPEVPENFASSTIRDIEMLPAGGWLAGNNNGVFQISGDMTSIKEVNLPVNNERKGAIRIIRKKDDEKVIIATVDAGIFALEDSVEEITPFTALDKYVDEKSLENIIYTADGNWVIIQGNTIKTIDKKGVLIASKNLRGAQGALNGDFFSFQTDSEGAVWAVKNYNLFKINPLTGIVENQTLISGLSSLLIDRSGVFWMGTSGFGLYKYDPKMERFGLKNTDFTETLAAGFRDKIYNEDIEGLSVIQKHIFGVYKPSQQKAWILTRGAGLFEYDIPSQNYTRHIVPIPIEKGQYNSGYSMDVDAEGRFTLLYANGIATYKPGEGILDFIPITDFLGENSSGQVLPVVESLTFIKKHAGYYWIGTTRGGLYALNKKTKEKTNFSYGPDNGRHLSSNHVLSITPDPGEPEKFMWVGTDGGGMNRIEIETGEVFRFTESEGLPNNVVYAIYPDTSGYLWTSSNKGISRIDPYTLEVLNFTKSDGLQSNEFNRREHYQFEDGGILFCGTFGCNLFNPDEVELNTSIPSVSFTDVSVMNESVLPFGSTWFTQADSLKVLNIDWNQNIIGFEFAALEFSGPKKNQYKYRFPPFLNEWTEIGTRREISFTNLDAGFYTMEVMGSNNDGIWSNEPARMGVQVFPPFWKTTTFQVGVILAFSSLVGGLVWYMLQRKYQQQVRELKYKMAVDQERLRISRDMHDDLGSRLTQIRMMSEFATADEGYSEKIKSRFEEISQESKDVIQNLSEIVWSLNPKNDTLDNLADYMVTYTENFCRKVNIACRIKADESFSALPLISTARHNLLSVLKEALNNAAKYARCTEIHLTLKMEGKHFLAEIRDNGQGFEPSKIKSMGQGLETMEQRMKEIHGLWILQTRIGEGTSITMRYPAHPNG